jgi:hypothetical protein
VGNQIPLDVEARDRRQILPLGCPSGRRLGGGGRRTGEGPLKSASNLSMLPPVPYRAPAMRLNVPMSEGSGFELAGEALGLCPPRIAVLAQLGYHFPQMSNLSLSGGKADVRRARGNRLAFGPIK